MRSPEAIYQERINRFSDEIAKIRKPLAWIPWVRFFLFIMTGVAVYNSFRVPGSIFIFASVLAFAGFLLAGWYDSRLKRTIKRLEILSLINQHEVAALGGDLGAFGAGNRFVSHDHPYSHDLDIFGAGSIFQHLNRTKTVFGEERLADYFNNAFQYRDAILQRQKAIDELAVMIDFRQQFQLIFHDESTKPEDLSTLDHWLNGDEKTTWLRHLKTVAWVLPAITVATIFLSIADFIGYPLPVMLVTIQMLIVFSAGRKTMIVHQHVTSQDSILRKYARAFSLIETAEFRSDFLVELQNRLRSNGSEMPGQVIRRLSNQLNMMDSNLNMLVSTMLNGLFMFNIHVIYAVEQWRLRYRQQVPRWFTVLAELDALSSLGTFAFNHPGYAYPEPVQDDFMFMAEELGHPMIPAGSCVTNDIEIRGWNQFRIITGANMSGKSTFLRTIGVNLLLAMAGAPVYARKLIFYPIEIHSSIRTNDSLAKRESYFYAELRRLKEIIAELECGRQKLILLDEILKGTNSSDKQTGSMALIRQLMKYKLAGLFATHDLALGELIHHYPANIRNLCFEIHITGDRMEIDYRIQPGVCKNLNASFLMRNMGIILDEEPGRE